MGTKMVVEIGSSRSVAELLDDDAPDTVGTLKKLLPISDRTIQVRWSGNAWRTEKNHELTSPNHDLENPAGRLSAGDIIYLPGYRLDLLKLGFAYGQAQWLAPFGEISNVSLIGHITEGLDSFVSVCQRIIFDGPLSVKLSILGS